MYNRLLSCVAYKVRDMSLQLQQSTCYPCITFLEKTISNCECHFQFTAPTQLLPVLFLVGTQNMWESTPRQDPKITVTHLILHYISIISSSCWFRDPFAPKEPFALAPLVSASEPGTWWFTPYREFLHLCSTSMDWPCGDLCSAPNWKPLAYRY